MRRITPISLMVEFADQLKKAGHPLHAFKEELTRYRKILRPTRTRQTQDEKAPPEAGRLVADVFDELPQPKLARFLEDVIQTIFYLVKKYIFRRLQERENEKRARLAEAPESVLTEAFVTDINRQAAIRVKRLFRRSKPLRILLFLDHFERLPPEVGHWLTEQLLEATIDPHVVLVVAGEASIEHALPVAYQRWHDVIKIHPMLLEGLDKDVMVKYLQELGIAEPDRQVICDLSQGLPLFLKLLTANGQGGVDPKGDIVTNFLSWIPLGDPRRRLVLDAALFSMPFREHDLAALPTLLEGERARLWIWLSTLSFVPRSRKDGRYSYHPRAQALFRNPKYWEYEDQHYETRRALAAHYRKQLEALEEEPGQMIADSAEWLELALARAYQLFLLPEKTSANYIDAMEQVLDAHQRTQQVGPIIRVLDELSKELSSPSASASALLALKHYMEVDLHGA